MLRMGAAVSVTADQTPLGSSFVRIVSLDDSGREVREVASLPFVVEVADSVDRALKS